MEVMQFGKFKGRLISDIPTDYLQWGAKALKGGVQRQFQSVLALRTGEKPKSVQTTSCGSWDCSRMFDPNAEWPDKQPWDGFSAPWLDHVGNDELSAEFSLICG